MLLERRGTIRFATRTCHRPRRFWLSAVIRTLISPCCGRDFDGRTSRNLTLEPQLVAGVAPAAAQRNSSNPTPTMPPAGF